MQLLLPPPVGQDLQGFGLGILLVPFGAPPLLDAVDGERRGVGGLADEDGAGIGPHVVDAVGDGAALGRGWKVVVVDQFGAVVPLGTGVLERANEFLLLGVDADDRRVVDGAALAQFGDVLELVVAVRVRGAGTLLVVDAQRESHFLEKPGDGPARRCRSRACTVRRRPWRSCGVSTSGRGPGRRPSHGPSALRCGR